MSSLWTPGGEHDVPRARPGAAGGPGPTTTPSAPPGPAAGPDDETELAAIQQELASTPAAVVIGNHCVGLFQLAALHLSQQPPNLDDARLSIDALGALVEGLEGRLGADEPTLVDALAQLRLAFVQIVAAMGGGTDSADSPDKAGR